MKVSVTLRRLHDLSALEATWRELETRAAGSFFQSWIWVGCLAHARYDDPVLLEATCQGVVVALALFNRRAAWWGSETLWLGETGRADHDAVFVERNGPLVARGYEDLLPTILRAAATCPLVNGRFWRRRKLVLGGVGDGVLAGLGSLAATTRVHTREAYFVDLPSLGEAGHLGSLGRSTRHQISRSLRRLADRGEVTFRRADTLPEALGDLEGLAALHQASWTDRGRPGAFQPGFTAFHQALLARALPGGHVDLWRLAAGRDVIGYLYNFRYAGQVHAYQSGFDYRNARKHEQPGLTAHHLAIEQARRSGQQRYDLLAGSARYKASLAGGRDHLHWVDAWPGRFGRLDRTVERLARSIRTDNGSVT